jgi:hypothetical protein
MTNASTLQSLVDWANTGVAISLALSFIFGATSIYLAKRLATIKDAESDASKKQFELRTKARGMTDDQVAHLRKYLADMPRSTKKLRVEIVRAVHRFPVTETSEIYANQLAQAIQEAGFPVSIIERPENEIPRSGIPVQYFIFGEDNPASRLVSAVQGALLDFGIFGTQYPTTSEAYKNEELVRWIIGLNP